MARRKITQKTIKQNPFAKKQWMKTVLFATPGGVALAIMIVSILTGCATPPSPSPLVMTGKLMVDHQIIVPDGGILFQNDSKTGGSL